MKHLKTNQTQMALPEPAQPTWLTLITVLIPWATIFGLCFTAIDKVFKYYSAAQDARLRVIVHEEVKPELNNLKSDISNLTTAIDQLKQSIWDMKK
jgi:hypothetical protein